MKQKLIHIIGAGGVAGIGMTRSLKKHYQLQGKDLSRWAEQVMECERESEDPNHCDMIIPVPDPAVLFYAECDLCFLPSRKEIELCQDKSVLAELLGDLAPITYWVRDTHGAGGRGAQMASEYLPGRNYSCELLYHKGNLLGHFMKERLAYNLMGSKEPTHQIGSSAVSRCINDHRILTLAKKAINKISKSPNGVYALDFKENKKGEPKITEVNAGRFLTASYVYYYLTDYNLPLLMVKTFFGEKYKLGKYPEGQGIIRQVDSLPYIGKV